MEKCVFSLFCYYYWFERERETCICYSVYLCIHWLTLTCALTGDGTCNPGALGRCSNWLSHWPRAIFFRKHFIYFFLERGEGREKQRERNIDWLPFEGPDWEFNKVLFILGENAQLSHTSQDRTLEFLAIKEMQQGGFHYQAKPLGYRITSPLGNISFGSPGNC